MSPGAGMNPSLGLLFFVGAYAVTSFCCRRQKRRPTAILLLSIPQTVAVTRWFVNLENRNAGLRKTEVI